MTANKNWYEVNNIQEIDSPALLVFPQRVKHNIQTAIAMVGDVNRLRPHVKTNKSIDVVKLMQETGIQKFKCATICEAEMLAMAGAKDVILAYQPTGPKLKRFIALIKKYPGTDFACLTDNLLSANEQINTFSEAGLALRVYIDLNVGMNRSGIAPGKELGQLISFLKQTTVIKTVGLHVYDGHMRNPDYAKKEAEINEVYSIVDAVLKDMLQSGLPDPNVVIGGSPGFSVHAKRKNVECSPGTFIYWDKGYADICPEQQFLPAAVLLTRVISFPAAGLMTTDLGHKSVAAENPIGKRVHFLNDASLTAVSQSEEHLVLKNEGEQRYRIGDVLYALPIHICPTVALYEKVLTVQDGNCSGEWITTARNRTISI